MGIILTTLCSGTDVFAAEKDRELKDLPTSWDFSDLFEDRDAFEADIKHAQELATKVEELKGTLNTKEGILNYIEDPEIKELNIILNKAILYGYCLNSLNSTDPWALEVSAAVDGLIEKYDSAYAYEDSEIMEMPLEKRQEIFSSKELAPYAYYYRKYCDPDHVLVSEDTEKAIAVLTPALNSQDVRNILEYVERKNPTFKYPDGKEAELTDQVYYGIIRRKEYDHEFRKGLYQLRADSCQPYVNSYAALLESKVRENWALAQLRGFDSSLEAALYETDVDPKVYYRIIEFGEDIVPKIDEYNKARKILLGLEDEMMIFDSHQPVTDYVPREISYEEAVNTGRKGISIWGDEYLECFDKIITSPHIDVYPSDTKEGGAYSFLVGNETTPYVMYNFDDSESYISTIVHEMGHAVYSQLSSENQNDKNNYPTIFTQEVASTANEIMFHKYMIENAATKDEKLYWLDAQIRLLNESLITQCWYAEFEDFCYKTVEDGGSLSAEVLSEKNLELMKKYYGKEYTIPDYSGIKWMGIPHFYNNYYVYQYATAITYAASICEQVYEKGQEEKDAYLEFLKAGNSTDPVTLLKGVGVDPLDDDTYETAEKLISDLVDEFIETSGVDISEKK